APAMSLGRAGLAVVVALGLGLPVAVSATPDGAAIWLDDGALKRQPLDGGEATAVVADLPLEAATRLEAAADGSAVLIVTRGPALWIDLSADAKVVRLPCRAAARLAADGARVACAVRGGQAIFALRPPAAPVLIE